jgi:glycerol uptake facilitator-like aquaporin
MASVMMRPHDAPKEKYEPLASSVGNGIALSNLRDEEKQQSRKVGTVYHTTNSGTVIDAANPDGFHYPVTWPSMWEWAAADAAEDAEDKNGKARAGYYDLVPSGATEFIGTTVFSLVVNTMMSLHRGSSAPPYTSVGFFPYQVAIVAGLTYMFIHSTMWMHSVNLFPALSFIEVFSPHSWKRYDSTVRSPGATTGYRWGQAFAMLGVQWVAQFIGTLFGTWIAFMMEDTTFNPMDDFARAGRAIVIGATATQAGVLVAFGFFLYCIAYYAMTLENYRNSSAQTRSIYTGFALMVAYFFSYSQTSSVFNSFQPLASSIVLAGSSLTSPWHIWNSDVTCGGAGASCFSNTSYWAIYTFPTFIAAGVAYLLWLFVLRLTSQSTSYGFNTNGKPFKSA